MATITHRVIKATETSLTVQWTCSSVVRQVQYTIDDGESWELASKPMASSGTFTIYGLSADTRYRVGTRVVLKSDGTFLESWPLEESTIAWPYCTDAPNFTIGDKVTLSFHNPFNRVFTLTINLDNGSKIERGDWSGDTYVWDTSLHSDSLYNSIPIDSYGYYTVTLTDVDGGTLFNTESFWGIYSVNVDESRPEFTDFEVYNDEPETVAVTGSDKIIVDGVSVLGVRIPSANKMVAQNGARPIEYIIDYEDCWRYKIDYTDGEISQRIGFLNESNAITVTAVDSRELFTTVQKSFDIIPWDAPVVYATAKRKNNFENETILSVSGTYSPVVVDGVEKNGLISLAYKYREVGGDWIGSGGFNFTASGGKFKCEDTFKDLDNSKAYEFEVTVIDKFNVDTTEIARVDVGAPIFFISSSEKKCYVNGQEVATVDALSTIGDDVPTTAEIIDSVHPVGSVFITNTNTNPNTLLKRGAWTLIDKEFTPSTANTTDFFNADELITNSGGYLVRGGHSIRVRQLVTIDVQANDEDLLLGNFLWEQMGINNIAADMIERMSFSDGANGGIVYYVANTSGNVTVKDVFDAPSVSGKKFYLEFVIVVDHTRMIDSYCNKFYWKRTS